jgi:glycosyltransferase involved in cell wall biosynthesis
MTASASVFHSLSDPPKAEPAMATRELRVLQVFHSLGMGGAETWLISLLKYFQKHNRHAPVKVKFDVLLTGGEKAVFDDEATALGARLFYVPFTRRTIGKFVREFRRILRDGNYDAIHDHQDYIAGLHFAIGAGLLPRVRITHVHNPLYHRANQAKSFSTRKVNRLGRYFVGRYATHVMGTSRQIVSEYGFVDLSGAVTLGAAHCGFDVEQYRGEYLKEHTNLCREFGWDDSAKILLFVGRLEGAEFFYHGKVMTHKNPAFALDIARECILRDDRVKLLMVGSGEEKRKEFEDEVKSWGLQRNIHLAGSRWDVPRLMLGSDLLLFPSVAEGLGMVVVEAQAAGLRVLAADTTPRESSVVPELLEFLSLDETPAKWAELAIRMLELKDTDFARANSHVNNSSFSIQESAQRLLGLYTHVPFGKRRRGRAQTC